MAAYLGKISAVISANTQDFTRAMGTTRRELDDFEKNVKKKLQGFQLNLDVGSFDKTLTKLQLFRRTVEEANKLGINTSRIERMFEVFEDAGKPLIAVKNDIEKLSNAVQAHLYPALAMAQKSLQDMQNSIKNGFSVPADSVDLLIEKIARLRASTAVVKDIDSLTARLMPETSGATFVQPYALDEMQRSAALRDRAAKMPADIRSDPSWQAGNVRVATVSAEINKSVAAVEEYKEDLKQADIYMSQAKTGAEKLSSAWLRAHAAANLATAQERLDGQLVVLRKINDATEKRLRLEEETAKQSKMFISASGGAGDKLDPTLEGAASDIMTVRQFRGNFGAENVMGRLNVTRGIQDSEERITALIRQRHEIEQDSLMTNQQMAVALDDNRRAIEQETNSLLRYTAAQSGGAFNEDQILAAATRRRKNTGSMGMGRFGNLDLAFQQGMFAIDDFMSATGELEYKLRAVSNNITQLGLSLGQSGLIKGLTATTGLFLGLAAVIGAEVAIAIGKWVFGADKAKDKTAVLNEAMSSQRSNAEKLAKSYESLAKSIGDVAMAETKKRSIERQETIASPRQTASDIANSRIAASSPDIVYSRVNRKGLEKKLEESTRGWFETEEDFLLRRAALAAGMESGKRIEDRLIARRRGDSISDEDAKKVLLDGTRRGNIKEKWFWENNADLRKELADAGQAAIAAGGRGNLIGGLLNRREIMERKREETMTDASLSRSVKEQRFEIMDREIARINQALDRFADVTADDVRAMEGIARHLFMGADELGRGVEALSGVFGGRAAASRIQSDIDGLSVAMSQVEKMAATAAARGEDPAIFNADVNAMRDMAVALRLSADYVAQFSEAMNRATGSLEQDVAAMRSRADAQKRLSMRMEDAGNVARAASMTAEAEDARRRKDEIEADVATALERAESAPGNLLRQRRVAEIDAQLAVAANTIGDNGIAGGAIDERENLRRERLSLIEETRRQLEGDPAVAAIRQAVDAEAAKAEMAAAADRGRILGLSPAAKAREEMDAKIADIAAQADSLRGDDKFDFVRQAMGNMAKEVAPLLAQFGEEVRNSQLAGPNRAALNASDVTTMQGQSELQRLLRKDDPARDVNFVELQKQTTLLQELPQKLAEATGIILDFK